MSRLTFLVTVITLTLTGVILASGVKSQNLKEVKVSVNTKSIILKELLTDLEKKSGFSFVYSEEIGNISNVNLSAKTTSLYEILKEIAEQKRLRFNQESYLIALVKAPPLPIPQKPGKISGKVLDNIGKTLPGATIKVIETGIGTQSSVDGSYSLSLRPGTYTLEISYISFQTQRITGVVVSEGKNTSLDIAMKPDATGLKEVVVTADYKKISVEGLLTRQKNAAEMTNGISAEQIGHTPDKNIGESLKRISGVSTVDNKFVIVRGISERYNAAVLDGTPLPSTEAQSRNFSFDLIPSNLVDNIVVSKTVTPDMNTSFGGGLIQINTKDMPAENFMSFSIGTSYNDQTTGKPFFSHKRGKYDYLGFDDGRRSAPDNLLNTDPSVNQEIPKAELQQRVDEQSRRFKNDNFTLYKNPALPNQNYQFTLGRLISLDTAENYKLGFTAALSYRNTQNTVSFSDYHRGKWNAQFNNNGNSYSFNTTWGGLLNMGIQLGKHRFSIRNTYTRMFDNDLVRTTGYADDVDPKGIVPPNIRENDDPTFTGLLQNKLMGQHQLGKIKLEWDAARTSIKREEKDLISAEQIPALIDGNYIHLYAPGSYSEPKAAPMSRQYYQNNESHYTWSIAGTLPFNIGSLRNSVKIGYYGNRKKAGFDWQIVPLTVDRSGLDPALKYLSVADMQKPENMHAKGYMYQLWFADGYSGKSRNEAAYLMLDNRFAEKLRLIWGIRSEYYKYTEFSNPKLVGAQNDFTPKKDLAWRWLPSANLTYSVTDQINVRGSWSIAVVRPELMDNSQFYRYSPYLNGTIQNAGITSTKISSYDLRTEWFPSLGETISVSGFYKYFDKPVELSQGSGGNIFYLISNSEWARVYGLEFELRKNLGFIASKEWLSNLTLFGNATLQKSKVEAHFTEVVEGVSRTVASKFIRPMSGQSPYLMNAGLQYQASRLGFNLVYNKSGRKTYIVSSKANLIDYEMPRSQTDAQISYKWLKNKLLVKLNAGNLFNKSSAFYKNRPDPLAAKESNYTPGKSENYEAGEQRTFTRYFGRTFSLQLNYNF